MLTFAAPGQYRNHMVTRAGLTLQESCKAGCLQYSHPLPALALKQGEGMPAGWLRGLVPSVSDSL